jgi:hypothetical protein
LLISPWKAEAVTGGPTIPVTTEGGGGQFPTLDVDAAGRYTVAWEGPDASSQGIYVRRFDTAGTPLSGEIAVNLTTADPQQEPAVACDDEGNFVVAWHGGAPFSHHIYARSFDSSGTPLSGEIPVSTSNTQQLEPAIEVDQSGGFAVAWASHDQDGSGWGTYMRRFDAAGAPLSGEIAVNVDTAGDEDSPAIAPGAAGGFAVMWRGNEPEGPSRGYLRLFDAAGVPLSGEVPIGPATGEGQFRPAIAAEAGGGFDVTWETASKVQAGRFDSGGNAVIGPVRVDPTTIDGNIFTPGIAADPDGAFTVTFEGLDPSLPPDRLFVRRFNSAGVPLSDAVPISPNVQGSSIVADGSGGIAIAWSRHSVSPESNDVYLRDFVSVPETKLDQGPTGLINDPSPNFAFSADEPGSTFECKFDSGSFSACVSPMGLGPLSDGPHAFRVRATNQFGKTDGSPAEAAFTVDMVAPNAQINAGPSGPIFETEPSFAFSTDDPGATLECKLDFGPFTACASPLTLGPLGDGAHTFSVRARDGAGNFDVTPAAREFSIDTQSPVVSIMSGPPRGSKSNDATPTFDFDANESVTFECQVDDEPLLACGSPFTTQALPDGPHEFSVTGRDQSGHTGSDNREFTIDTIAPDTSIDSGPSGPTQEVRPSFFFGSGDPGSTFECRVDGGGFSPCDSPFKTHALLNGPHSFSVRATDEAENTDPTPAIRRISVDTVAPDTFLVAKNPSPSKVTTPTFSFSSSEPGSNFECSLDGGAFVRCVPPRTTAHLADGLHGFSVRAVDLATNVDPSPASMEVTVDTHPPSLTTLADRTQSSSRPIKIRIRCSERCSIIARGEIPINLTRKDGAVSVKSVHAVRLGAISRRLPEEKDVSIFLKPRGRSAWTKLRRLINSDMRIRAVVWVRAIDLAGNATNVSRRIQLSVGGSRRHAP